MQGKKRPKGGPTLSDFLPRLVRGMPYVLSSPVLTRKPSKRVASQLPTMYSGPSPWVIALCSATFDLKFGKSIVRRMHIGLNRGISHRYLHNFPFHPLNYTIYVR